MSDQKIPHRQGFIIDGKHICAGCAPPDAPYKEPWLYEGERFDCDACKQPFRVPSDDSEVE